MKIGVCGLGNMGSALAQRLMDVGHELTVWNRTSSKADSLVSNGAIRAETAKELVDGSDIVVVMLLDDSTVNNLYGDINGLLAGNLSGKTLIEMSTVKPATIIALAKKVKDAGGAYVECPVAGTVGPAREGQLMGLVGANEEDFNIAKPVLDQLCRRVERVGNPGSGAYMKLATNLPLIVYWEALGEALNFARQAGIDLEQAGSILADTSGAIKVAPMRIPAIVEAIDGNSNLEAWFQLSGMAKDLRLMSEVAKENELSVPAVEATRDAYDKAIEDGWSDRDGTLLSAWRVLHKSR
ncbi:MAG: NAD(P)-dependent oxidoreductase [Rhizobiaceae bacterium]